MNGLLKQLVTEDGNKLHHCMVLKRKEGCGKLRRRNTGILANQSANEDLVVVINAHQCALFKVLKLQMVDC